jgi:DNA invertase Pin-like site-specific DNA recombinase
MPKRYRKREEEKADPYRAQPLPLHRPVAVYYRQSSEGQIGNINTTLQTVDMVEHLVRQGWARDSIEMIDMDAGVSGTTKLADRKGMARLMTLIESGQISLVAAQEVDRFFRDVTQIQTNLFIDACKRNNVRVMTPRMVYDFNHPMMGAYLHPKGDRSASERSGTSPGRAPSRSRSDAQHRPALHGGLVCYFAKKVVPQNSGREQEMETRRAEKKAGKQPPKGDEQ